MARPRKTPSERPKAASREANLRERAAARGYTLEQEGGVWWAVVGGTRFGPLRTLDDVDEFLPAEEG